MIELGKSFCMCKLPVECRILEKKLCRIDYSSCVWYIIIIEISLGCVWLSSTPWTVTCQALPLETIVVVVQSLSCVQTAARQASLSVTNSQSLPKLMSIESMMPSNHLIFCRPLLLLPSIFPSIRVFSDESALRIRWPKYWSFSLSPSDEYSEMISFGIDWLVWSPCCPRDSQEFLQHHSSKVLWCSAFFIVQLSHLYVTTGKTIALTIQTFVSKVMSLLFNMLSRSVIAFLPRSECL